MNLEARLDEVRAEYLRRIGGQAACDPSGTAGESSETLDTILSYISARSGKMLRPRMLLAAAALLQSLAASMRLNVTQ